MVLRTIWHESFLGLEYMQFQAQVVNNLDTSDFIDLDFHQIHQWTLQTAPFFISLILMGLNNINIETF